MNEGDQGDCQVTQEIVQAFTVCQSQLRALLSEFSVLSKSKPDSALNKFKTKAVNTYLARANALLADATPIPDFTEFDDADLPSNSDVVMVLSQYLAALEVWRSERIESIGLDWYWSTVDGSAIETSRAHRP